MPRWVGWLGAAALASSLTPSAALAQGLTLGQASLLPRRPDAPARIAAAGDAAERMTVPVAVDGRGPFPFVVDTGADRTVISRELANDLGLRPGGPVRLNEVAGVELIPTAHISELRVGPRLSRDVFAPLLGQGDLGAAGLLGIDALRGQRVVLDFSRRLMTVEPSQRERLGPDTVVVTARSRYGQLVLVDAAIGSSPILVIIDSGAQNTIGNRRLEALIGGQTDGLRGQVISVSGRSTEARFATLASVRVGGIRVRNLPIAFADLHTFEEFGMNDRPAMLLGMDVLRHFDRVVIDFGRKQVSFQTPPPE